MFAKEGDSAQASKAEDMESQMFAFREQDLILNGEILAAAKSWTDKASFIVTMKAAVSVKVANSLNSQVVGLA